MKILFTTISALLLTVGAQSQDFQTSLESATVYKASAYPNMTRYGVFTSDQKLIHGSDEFEVIDLRKGSVALTYDFEGDVGKTWVDFNGRYVGNYSQNVAKLETGWVDGFQAYDLQTAKLYTKHLDGKMWTKGVFHPGETQILLSDYKVGESETRVILYDFVNDKEIKSYFSSSKGSTIVMDLAFSKDGSKIYAGIAPNGFTSYINIYDTQSGEMLKKISFKYNLDKIFVAGDYVYCSGVDGNSGDPFTSRIDPKTYEVKTWDTFRMSNVHPSGTFCYEIEYPTTVLSKYDLTTGQKTDLFDVSSLGMIAYGYAASFSEDGRYFMLGLGRKKGAPDYNNALVVFKNELMEEIVEEEIEEPPVVELVELPSKYTYKNNTPKFQVELEGEPEVKEEQTKSGGVKLTIKQSPDKNTVYMIMLSEMSSKIKESKYTKTAAEMGEKFMSKMDVAESKKGTMTIDGQTGTEYTFTKKGVYYRYVSICIDGYAYQLIFLNSAGDGATGDDFYQSFTTK